MWALPSAAWTVAGSAPSDARRTEAVGHRGAVLVAPLDRATFGQRQRRQVHRRTWVPEAPVGAVAAAEAVRLGARAEAGERVVLGRVDLAHRSRHNPRRARGPGRTQIVGSLPRWSSLTCVYSSTVIKQGCGPSDPGLSRVAFTENSLADADHRRPTLQRHSIITRHADTTFGQFKFIRQPNQRRELVLYPRGLSE